MKIKRETRQVLTILALLVALMVFNAAIVFMDRSEGGPARTKGQIRGNQVLVSTTLQGDSK